MSRQLVVQHLFEGHPERYDPAVVRSVLEDLTGHYIEDDRVLDDRLASLWSTASAASPSEPVPVVSPAASVVVLQQRTLARRNRLETLKNQPVALEPEPEPESVRNVREACQKAHSQDEASLCNFLGHWARYLIDQVPETIHTCQYTPGLALSHPLDPFAAVYEQINLEAIQEVEAVNHTAETQGHVVGWGEHDDQPLAQ